MLTRLAEETRAFHAAADGDRLALMARSSARTYRSCLWRIYCFEQPVEAALARTPEFDPSLLRTHLKTTRLANDLRGLGVSIDNIAQPAAAFDDVAQALGWLYVIHRNTLYHGVLLRQLKMLIPGEIQIAGSYLAAFEGLAGVRMREFGLVLDRAARRGNVAGRVVAGANEALRRQRQWYSVRSAAPSEAAISDKVVSAKPGFSRGTASSFLAGRPSERVAGHHSGTPKENYVDLRISGLVVEE